MTKSKYIEHVNKPGQAKRPWGQSQDMTQLCPVESSWVHETGLQVSCCGWKIKTPCSNQKSDELLLVWHNLFCELLLFFFVDIPLQCHSLSLFWPQTSFKIIQRSWACLSFFCTAVPSDSYLQNVTNQYWNTQVTLYILYVAYLNFWRSHWITAELQLACFTPQPPFWPNCLIQWLRSTIMLSLWPSYVARNDLNYHVIMSKTHLF